MADYESCMSTMEKCRVCGIELSIGSMDAMYHYNCHWRQQTTEPPNLTQCVYESPSDMRLPSIVHNSEDIEVSCHFDQGIQYSYSPQTEPSNLCLSETRCSPLNLTGRPKSPMVSPLSSPLPHDHQVSLQNVTHYEQSHVPYMQESFDSYNPMNSCSMSNQMMNLPFPINDMSNCLLDSSDYQLSRKRKKGERAADYAPQHFQQPPDSNQSMPYTAPVKPYKCSICNEEFVQKLELLEHTSLHDAAKPYRCNLCGTGLSHISALRRHTLAHAGLKPHVCDICSRGFFQKCDLQRHYSIHRKKTIQCTDCHKKYSSEYLLKNHKCKPEEIKPFPCTICGEGCATNIAWSYHMWKHTKNPIFVPCQSVTPTPPKRKNVSD